MTTVMTLKPNLALVSRLIMRHTLTFYRGFLEAGLRIMRSALTLRYMYMSSRIATFKAYVRYEALTCFFIFVLCWKRHRRNKLFFVFYSGHVFYVF